MYIGTTGTDVELGFDTFTHSANARTEGAADLTQPAHELECSLSSTCSPQFTCEIPNFKMSFTTKSEGETGTLEWALYYEKDGKRISPFHDIPVVVDEAKGIYNMVVEIPKGTNAKLEISKDKEFNPIVQDTKNGKLRFVADIMGGKGYPWNYGAFPQTWEDPTHKDADTECLGDNDPLDVCDISSIVGTIGGLKQVKVLGTLAMIDEGETDWKIIAIDVNDPLAEKLNDIADVEAEKPGYLKMVHDWFRDYKIPDGKPANSFAFDGEVKDKAFALNVVKSNQGFWQNLMDGKADEKAAASINTTRAAAL
eukprot:TRINITY_DN16736_c0_g1_i1.p2 TRINITY_DN16736_c0_g1~~TRINITY_DN16736_c0_g1_i1.p2  ORF type:complete len:310 (-),score=95.87 TRINITY_DN16736_c0_g1_i1:92-1021(-)